MGKVLSLLAKPLHRYNVENRAHKIISKEKPVAAPKYPSNVLDIERAIREEPDFKEKEAKKDDTLDNRLKSVFVTSQDPDPYKPERQPVDSLRPLPLNRKAVKDEEYGFAEPDKVRYGRCTLKQAMQFIGDHQAEPETWTSVNIATKYKLDEKTIGNILQYYRAFQLYVPPKEGGAKKSGESVLDSTEMRKLGEGKQNTE